MTALIFKRITLKKKIAVAAAVLVLLPLTSTPAYAHATSGSAAQNASIIHTKIAPSVQASNLRLPSELGSTHKVTMSLAQTAMKTTANLHLRQKASTSSKSLGIIKKGSTVKPTGKKNGKWVEIRFGSKTGWASSSYLAATKAPAPKTQYRYAQRDGNVYKTASKNDKKAIGTLKKGAKVEWRQWHSTNRRDEVKVNGKWVWTDITAPNKPAAAPAPKPGYQDKNVADYGRFVTANLNLRQGPGTQHKLSARVPLGDKVSVTHHTSAEGWVRVRHGSRTGYVSSAYLNKTGQYSVAVYGTLRTGQSAYSVMGNYQQKNVNQQIAKSSLYQLWNRNWTFLTNGPKTVVAEQFQYGNGNGASMMKKLDIYEGQLKYQGKQMYSRQRVTLADGSVSWAYKTTATGEKVAKSSGNLVSSGDFLKRS